MNDDLDVTPTEGGGGGMGGSVDPLYQAIYGGGEPVAPVERRVGFPTLAPFTHYVLKPIKATRRRSEKNVGARLQVEVVEGPGGVQGFKFTDSGEVAFGFVVSRTGKNGETLDDAAWLKKCNSRRGLLARVQQALKLSFANPRSFSDADVDAYAAQFEHAAPFVAEVSIEKGSDGVARNRIQWSSVAALDEKVTDPSSKFVGKTALEEAREMIRLRDQRTPTGKPTVADGRTSGSLGPADLR